MEGHVSVSQLHATVFDVDKELSRHTEPELQVMFTNQAVELEKHVTSKEPGLDI